MRKYKVIIILIFTIGFLITREGLAPGMDYYVSAYWGDDATGDGSISNPWETIQFAIDNAVVLPSEYTNIYVDRGTYTENIVFRERIRLFGGYDSQQGWIRDLQSNESRIKAASSSLGSHTVTMVDGCRLDGFTVSDGYIGIYCDTGTPEIFNNIIESHKHYGIIVLNSASPVIQQNEIRHNKGGIYCAAGSSAIITLNTITENYEQGINCNGASPTIYRNTILHNYLSGVYCIDNSAPMIVGNRINRNLSAGVFTLHSQPILANNFIVGNGIGINARNWSSIILENNTCDGNGGSAVLLSNSGGILKNNIFSNNEGYGIEENDADSDPEVIYNCFFENKTADYFDEGTSAVIGAELINSLVYNAPQVCANNISGDPRFLDPVNGDVHLTSGSVCIDAGTTSTYNFDIDLENRPFDILDVDNNGTLPEHDIGADEFVNRWLYDFEPAPQGWVYGNVVPVYSAATSIVGEGYIGLRAVDWNCFSYWTSPPAINVRARNLYRLLFTLRSDSTDQSIVPGVRLRINRSSYQTSADLVIQSTGNGENSPSAEGTTYTLYVEPIQGPITQTPDPSDTIIISFDILNFDTGDDPTGGVFLDSVEVDMFALNRLDDHWTTEAIFNFDTDSQGWQSGGAPEVFDLPSFSVENGALCIKSTNNTNTFGFWYSPAIPVSSNKFYSAKFYITTDQYTRLTTPAFRMRLNATNGQLATTYSVYSVQDADSSPQNTELVVYNLYLAMRENIDQIIGAIDLMNFDPMDDPNGEIILGHFTLDSCPLELLP